MAEGSVSSDAAFEKSSRILAILCKLVILKSFAVFGTYACIQGVIENVADLVGKKCFLSDPGRPGPIYVSGSLKLSDLRC